MKYLLLLLLSLPLFLNAQKPQKSTEPEFIEDKVGTFRAGLILGANGSQIDGDGFAGYNYLGFNAGGKMLIVLHKRWQPGFELLYSQKGSSENTDLFAFQYKYSLDYIQIPVLIHYVDRRIMFEAGVSYNRLVRSKVKLAGIIDESFPEGFKKSDITLLGGMTFYLNPKKNFAVNGRFEISTMDTFAGNMFYPGKDPLVLGRQLNKLVSVRMYYMF